MGRIVLAFALAPLAVPLALAAFGVARGASRDQGILVLVAALYTYAITLVAGIPALFLYRHMGWSRAWQFALGGFLMGAAAFVGFARSGVDATLLFGGLGLVAASAFWLIGVRGNAAFALPRSPAQGPTVAPLQLPPADAIRERAGRASRRVRAFFADLGAAAASWRASRPAPAAPRPPVAGLFAVAIPLLTTVGTFPWIWRSLGRTIEKLYTLGMIVVFLYLGIVILLSGVTVIVAIVAIALRERYRFPLAATAVALAALGLYIMRRQV